MKKNLKLIALAMVFALLMPVFASCAENKTGDKGDATGAQGPGEDNNPGEAATEDPFAKYDDGLGEYDFKGEEFKIQMFENENVHNHIDAPEENGEVFNDAMYKRNRAIEERFNVTITEVLTDDFANAKTKRVVLAGDSDVFDMFDSRCPDALANWQEGWVYSYENIPVIDLSKPYWNNSANKTLTLGGSQYVALGNFNFASYEISHALLFNKTMIQEYALENPYTLVNEGTWTFDKMEELMKQVITDLNGDGAMDKNDRFGYLTHPKQVLPNFWIAAGAFSVGKDEADMPYLAMGSEKFLNAFDKTFSMLWDTGAYYLGQGGPDIPQYAIDMFGNGQSLFMDTTLFVIEKIRSLEVEFGIIPYPKYDAAQKNYVSRVEYYMAMQVPITNADLERAGVMLEALNSESAKTIIPAYYEIALKSKYARDDDSAQMLDLIFSTLVVDIGDTTLCDKIRDAFMATMFEKNNRDLASKIESTEKIILSFVEKIPQ
ncbi:MAG: hypothetical protein FWH48_02460 [Oscillospiraceae bacterium]|nr:hypothetical protein [Oscillospiraceae bacterium]